MSHAPQILLVESDDLLSEGLITYFEMNGYEVLHALDGTKALAAAIEEHPDVIISAHFLNPTDGLALLRAVRDDPRTESIPFVLVSGSASSRPRTTSHALGADAFFYKPFEIGKLGQKVAALIGRTK